MSPSKNLNYYFLTINYHPNDIPLFNMNLDELIIPFVEGCTRYYWCVEKDNTKSMHYHAVIGDNWRDVGSLRQKLNTLMNKCFKGKSHETLIDKLMKGRAINLSHKLENFKTQDNINKLGYIQKEASRNPRKATNLPDDTLEKNLNIFLNSISIKSNATRHKETIINLKGTTILSLMLDFIIDKDLNVKNLSFEELEDLAIDYGYSFINVSSYQKEQCNKEIRRRLYPLDDGYEYNTLQSITASLQGLIEDIAHGNGTRLCMNFVETQLEKFHIKVKDKSLQTKVYEYFN